MHYEEVPEFAESDFLSELGYGATGKSFYEPSSVNALIAYML